MHKGVLIVLLATQAIALITAVTQTIAALEGRRPAWDAVAMYALTVVIALVHALLTYVWRGYGS